MRNIPVLYFTYLVPEQINLVEEIISTSDFNSLKNFVDRYVLFSKVKDVNFHKCSISEMFLSDVSGAEPHVSYRYFLMYRTYPKELLDLLFIEDETIIINKIRDIIDFTLKDVCKTDMIYIEIGNHATFYHDTGRMPSVISSALDLYYDIKKRKVFAKDRYQILIEKRGV